MITGFLNTQRTILSVILATLMLAQCQFKEDPKKDSTEKGLQSSRPIARDKLPELIRDDRGNIIERHRCSYSKKDSSILSYESYYYTYDEHGNVIYEIKESNNPGGDLSYRNTNKYSYNKQNLKTEIIFESYDGSGSLIRSAHHVFKYNERGHKIEDTGYNPDGSVTARILMEPDSNGHLISEEFIQFDDLGKIRDHKKFYYSDHGLQKTVDLMKDE